jgi:threonine dehydrogenase-like Zn-dependent dehydrogenase
MQPLSHMRVVSVNVGLPRTVLWKRRNVSTGIFKEPVAGRVRVRRLNLDGDGTWQEYVLAPRSLVVPLPDGVNYMEAAALRTVYDTAYMGLVYHGHLQPGQVVFAPGVKGYASQKTLDCGPTFRYAWEEH